MKRHRQAALAELLVSTCGRVAPASAESENFTDHGSKGDGRRGLNRRGGQVGDVSLVVDEEKQGRVR